MYLFFSICVFHNTADAQIDHWETAVYADSDWKYELGNASIPVDWNQINYDDSNWNSGQGGIGYGDNDDNTIIDQTVSVFMRQHFIVTDISAIERAVFHADFDDGFIMYLNGVEITRTHLDGNPPTWDSEATQLREAEMYQGNLPISHYINKTDLTNILVEGQNIVAVQTHNFGGTNSSDLSSLYWLTFGLNNGESQFGDVPSWFPQNDFNSPIPIVKINTNGNSIPDEPSIAGTMGIIWNGEGNLNQSNDPMNEFFGNIRIEIRGQSSTLFPKKGYGIETVDENGEDLDVSFLNFPAEEDWILHGPYSDKSLIRNVVAMHLANSIGQYGSRTRLVELTINEQYEGVYVLMEKIKRDENRVDIATLKTEDIDGDELTGGYIFKVDKGEPDWFSNYGSNPNSNQKLSFQYVSPKKSKIQPAQAVYIQSYIDSFERALLNPSEKYDGKYYYEYIDMMSFIDHFILNEVTKDVDAYRISTYLHKDKNSNGGLVTAGPIWDFNLGLGNADYCEGATANRWMYDINCDAHHPFWWGKMMEDQLYKNTANCRYFELREGPLHIDSIFAFIDEKVDLLTPVVDRNFERWNILNDYVWPNAIVTGSYTGEINYLKQFIINRLNWMDNNMFGFCGPVITNSMINQQIKLFPNPSTGIFELSGLPKEGANMIIYDSTGKKCYQKKASNSVDISSLMPGFYFLELYSTTFEIIFTSKINLVR